MDCRTFIIVYCVTDELGRNRKERKEKTYKKIRSNSDAIIIKLADRITNIMNSLINGHMIGIYKTEHQAFKDALYEENDISLHIMWDKLKNSY